MKIRARHILVFLLFFLNFHAYGQESQNKKPLEEILQELQNKYSVKFNYLQSTIDAISVVSPSEATTIEESISILGSQTGLIFTFLANNFISIKKPGEIVLCGYLKDLDSQTPLIGATIQGAKSSTVSNENGYFQLRLEDPEEEITLRFLGYKTLQRNLKFLNTRGCPTVYMTLEYQSLASVILSSYLVEGINKMNTGEYQIDFSDFDILPGLTETDVLQTIQAFPGIQSSNETVSNINIRGGTHDQKPDTMG